MVLVAESFVQFVCSSVGGEKSRKSRKLRKSILMTCGDNYYAALVTTPEIVCFVNYDDGGDCCE